MTGKDLIIYILSNNLENEPVFNKGKFIGYLTVDEVASEMNVGTATVYAWIQQGWMNCVILGGSVYIPADFRSTLIKPKV